MRIKTESDIRYEVSPKPASRTFAANSLSRSFAECTDRLLATDGLIARGVEEDDEDEEEDKKEEEEEQGEDEGYSE